MNDISQPIDVNRLPLVAPAAAVDAEPVYASSFDDFYRARYRAAVRLGIVLTGSPGVAEDLAQDVFVEPHRRWSQLGEYENAAAWMRRTMVNRAISRSRRLAVSTRRLLRLRSQATTVPEVELGERDWELWRLVRALPARQAQLVALIYIEGLTLPVAAETPASPSPLPKPTSLGPRNASPEISPNGARHDRPRQHPGGSGPPSAHPDRPPADP